MNAIIPQSWHDPKATSLGQLFGRERKNDKPVRTSALFHPSGKHHD
jgi:hypothetical protein